MSIIQTTLTNGITLGSGPYTSPLIITDTGAVVASGPAISTGNDPVLIINHGLVESSGLSFDRDFAIYMASGTLVNFGTIEAGPGGFYAVDLAGGTDTVINHGVIQGGVNGDLGLMVLPGTFDVFNTGTIDGVNLPGRSNTIDNRGSIGGIELKQGGVVNNTGSLGGVSGTYGFVTLTNSGTVTNGVQLVGLGGPFSDEAGGAVSNTHGGVISGYTGVYLYQGIVSNAGTISGTGGIAVEFTGEAGGRVVDDPGAVFNGIVEVTGSVGGVLALAQAEKTGTLAGFGSGFTGFTSLSVDSGAKWDISGATRLGPGITLTNDGTIWQSSADHLTIDGNISGTGGIGLDHTSLILNGSVSAGQEVSFASVNDKLYLGDPSQFKGKITGFGLQDTIDLTDVARASITGVHFAGGVLILTEANGAIGLTFASPATFPDSFSLSAAGSGTDITLTMGQAARIVDENGNVGTGIKLGYSPVSFELQSGGWTAPDQKVSLGISHFLALPHGW
jgi:hypothetical protein